MKQLGMRAWTVGLLAGGALALAPAGAGAVPAGPAGPASAPSQGPQAVSLADLHLVVSNVEISSGDAVVARHACEWRVPGDEDAPCLAFAGDPAAAIGAVRAAGGDSARVHVVAQEIGLDSVSTVRRRADGTWLLRGESGERARGHVCSADGETCTRWDAVTARSAKAAVRKASARLRRKV